MESTIIPWEYENYSQGAFLLIKSTIINYEEEEFQDAEGNYPASVQESF